LTLVPFVGTFWLDMTIPMRRTKLGEVPNEGARQAWLALARLGWDQSKLRAEMQAKTGEKVLSGTLVKYLYCDRRPGVPSAELFQALLGVAPSDWYREPTEPFEPPAAKTPEAKAS
jgi:hypothetical protein